MSLIMMSLFIMMSIMASMIFIFMKHPLSMGLILIIQTVIISMITGLMIKNFWFSYILLITMLSGALVLFIYMASVASNEKFQSSIKMLYLMAGSLIISLTISYFMEHNMFNSYSIQQNMINNDQITSLIKMFNLHNMTITITVISYLFLTMIVISYIVDVFEGPLRTKN